MIIYFDANMPPYLARGFQIMQEPEGIKTGLDINVAYIPDVFGPAAKDIDWIPQIGKIGGCVITTDIHISKRKDEVELYQKHGVGLFFLRGPSRKQGLSAWQMLEALSKNWVKITEYSMQKNRPFAYKFGISRGVKEY